jgi:hypothetical protein
MPKLPQLQFRLQSRIGIISRGSTAFTSSKLANSSKNSNKYVVLATLSGSEKRDAPKTSDVNLQAISVDVEREVSVDVEREVRY